ncbi:sulfatase/phosphatase domain-containing protein [Pedobacter frigiditerrae]|uniref:sulfatase/phosphatase domain-containing protein n=1 Tax=Pedobacter frigiditerrae TaxID=2530452 RepID=UPI00197CEE03|nr:sulfatase/phosphatase domain-containing protein [Pedobacter frigiditerrae]
MIDKRHFYEESVKVPFLAYGPGVFNGGQTIENMVQNVDIAPTVLEMAGLQKPDHMPGKSFTQLLKGDKTNWRDKVFYEYYWESSFPMTPTIFGVRSDEFKFIKYHGVWDTNELYNIKKDPEELYNLAGKPGCEKIELEMASELAAWLKSTNGLQIPLKGTVKRPTGDYLHPYNH